MAELEIPTGTPTVAELKQVELDAIKTQKALEKFIEVATGQLAATGTANAETKSAIEAEAQKTSSLIEQCQGMEQKIAEALAGGAASGAPISMGRMVIDHDDVKAYQDGQREKVRIEIKAAVVNATGQNQPLVPATRLAGIIHEPNRVLRMRDVIAPGKTTGNSIEYAKEHVFTNAAAAQGAGSSPETYENVTKAESSITFTLAQTPVVTIAHWIPVSKQVIADSPMLESYINSRMSYGLKIKEDTQILLGTGNNGDLPGLYTNRTAFDNPSPVSTSLDLIRKAIARCHLSEYIPTAIVLHSQDWADLELAKDSQGRYLFANPQLQIRPMLWGLPVVVTNSMTSGTFLVGAFDMAAQLWDRENAHIELGMSGDNFVKNMVTILCEERVAQTVYRTAALVGGSLAG